MIKKNNYNYQELIDCGNGKLFGKGNAKLPLPPMLMFDRITEINDNKGVFNKGFIKAELDIKKDLWFFDCHFNGGSCYAWMSGTRCNVAADRFFSWVVRRTW